MKTRTWKHFHPMRKRKTEFEGPIASVLYDGVSESHKLIARIAKSSMPTMKLIMRTKPKLLSLISPKRHVQRIIKNYINKN